MSQSQVTKETTVVMYTDESIESNSPAIKEIAAIIYNDGSIESNSTDNTQMLQSMMYLKYSHKLYPLLEELKRIKTEDGDELYKGFKFEKNKEAVYFMMILDYLRRIEHNASLPSF